MLRATLVDGKLTEKDQQSLQVILSRFTGTVAITVQDYKRIRSSKQNRAYWKLLEILADMHKDYSAPQYHEIFKCAFLPRAIVKVGNREVEVIGTTKKLSTVQFSDYLERIRSEVAIQWQISLPEIEEIQALVGVDDVFYPS